MSMTFIDFHEVTSGTEATVTFSNIPQEHTDLVVFVAARTPRAATNDGILMTVNGGGSSVAKLTYANVGAGVTVASSTAFLINANSSTSGAFSNVEIYIGDYAGEDHKPYIINGVVENNAQQAFPHWSGGSFSTTSAISSITFDAEVDAYFSIGSKFYLYGITAGSDGTTTVSVV
jgi:hypothetical protein